MSSNPLPHGQVLSVNISAARPLATKGRTVMSGIGKRAAQGRVEVKPLGLAGDEQADPSVHGGIAKAVYAYPSEHYGFWQTVRSQARVSLWNDALPQGFMGENLTIDGLTEDRAWIGDLLRFPHCVLAVSEPRFPCFKFEAVMGFAQAAKLMVQSGYCGFYLSVRESGSIAAGERYELVPGPREVGVRELFQARMRR